MTNGVLNSILSKITKQVLVDGSKWIDLFTDEELGYLVRNHYNRTKPVVVNSNEQVRVGDKQNLYTFNVTTPAKPIGTQLKVTDSENYVITHANIHQNKDQSVEDKDAK